MGKITKTVQRAVFGPRGIRRRLKRLILRPLFASCGRNVVFDPDARFTYDRIHLGNDVYIGGGARFSASNSEIRIGDKVMFGPLVVIRGGNHNISELGRFMADVKEKRPEDDQPVVLEDDVWVGARVTILSGVRIGRGAVIGAGAVVSRNIPPYAVAVGCPARVIKFRFTRDEVRQHEESLYPPERRLDERELDALFELQG